MLMREWLNLLYSQGGVETTQKFFCGCIGRETAISTYTTIVVSLGKKWNPRKCWTLRHKMSNVKWLHSMLPQTKAALVGRRQNGGCWVGGGSQGLLINGDGNPVYNEEKVMEMIKTVGSSVNSSSHRTIPFGGWTVKHCAHFTTWKTKLCGAHHLRRSQIRTGLCSKAQERCIPLLGDRGLPQTSGESSLSILFTWSLKPCLLPSTIPLEEWLSEAEP